MDILISNIGKVIEGSVFDVAKKPFLRALQAVDPQLYIKWNGVKNQGRGCWEIRRRPNKKTAVLKGFDANGDKYFELEYVENDFINHVLDIQFLNYYAINKIKSMDTWDDKNWLENSDKAALEHKAQVDRKNAEINRAIIKDNRKYFQDLQEYVKSGYNPFSFFNGTKGNK